MVTIHVRDDDDVVVAVVIPISVVSTVIQQYQMHRLQGCSWYSSSSCCYVVGLIVGVVVGDSLRGLFLCFGFMRGSVCEMPCQSSVVQIATLLVLT